MPVEDQGIFTDRYTFIPRALIFATRGGSVLLLKGAPTKRIWPNLYNGVGGHIEPGESALEGAHREFLEETGLPLLSPWLAAAITINTGANPGIVMFVFRGEAGEGEFKPSQEGSLEWVPANRIHSLPLVEDLPILLPKVLDLSPGDQPLLAHYYYNQDQKLKIRFN
jgi:8-oxo-dGTP diphosphatase